MTTDEKQMILKLRGEGLGYKSIANTLKMPLGTIKTFCRRNGINGYGKEINEGKCLCCGIVVEQNPKRKQKKFCSDKCRSKWWNEHQEKIDKKAYHHKVCPCCNKEFEVYSTNSKKYCSHDCYIKHNEKCKKDA